MGNQLSDFCIYAIVNTKIGKSEKRTDRNILRSLLI